MILIAISFHDNDEKMGASGTTSFQSKENALFDMKTTRKKGTLVILLKGQVPSPPGTP